jgi:hypothetical protein
LGERDFAFEVAEEFVEFRAGEAQGLGFVAEDGLGGAVDLAAELLEVGADHGFELLGGGEMSVAEELFAELERLCELMGIGGAKEVEDRPGESALLEEVLDELLGVGGIGLANVAEGFVELA